MNIMHIFINVEVNYGNKSDSIKKIVKQSIPNGIVMGHK